MVSRNSIDATPKVKAGPANSWKLSNPTVTTHPRPAMRLGARDGSYMRFEENPEALQQDLWHTNAGMHQESSGWWL